MILYQDIENGNGLPASIATAGAGTVSVNTERMHGVIVQWYFKPATATTTYNVRLVEPKGRYWRVYNDLVGTFRDDQPLDVKGKHTLTIYTASVNEAFDVLMRVRENT